MLRLQPSRLLPLVAIAALLSPARSAGADTDEMLSFGTRMAREGNWREARYRWEQALKQDANNARLLNNLAVAHEVLGSVPEARDLYRRAHAAAPDDGRIVDNATRAQIFWGRAEGEKDLAAVPASGGSRKKGRDMVEVPVSLPLPPRLKLDNVKTLLVASFLVNDSELIDVNREMVRFLRSEFRKHTAFEVLDVNPPPAVPEQTLEEMAANAAFWTHLAREHGADVIISGAMTYTRRDASGFEDVDIVNEATGQKIKQTAFVEREEFTFDLDVLYMNGADGALLFRDKLRRQAFFRGSANDPISAFYQLG
ncbi:MAG TPA: tetratricopeptide repeat protein, partial [Candidatus Polarisedimenticolaceae bacterium]|nr:tetratricopeptide repeat protein [Candidatus Polarisedimenticolaceae bacterium]